MMVCLIDCSWCLWIISDPGTDVLNFLMSHWIWIVIGTWLPISIWTYYFVLRNDCFFLDSYPLFGVLNGVLNAVLCRSTDNFRTYCNLPSHLELVKQELWYHFWCVDVIVITIVAMAQNQACYLGSTFDPISTFGNVYHFVWALFDRRDTILCGLFP